MTPTTFTKVDTNLARLIVAAGPFADRLLIECGAAPEDGTIFDVFNAFLKKSKGGEFTRKEAETDDAFIEQFLARFPFEERDPVDSALIGLNAHRNETAYALGVAVGLRLAGGVR